MVDIINYTFALPLISRFIVPMKNGDLDSKGPLASLVQSEGTIESFKVCMFLTLYEV